MLKDITNETKAEFIKDAKTHNISMMNMKKHLIWKIYVALLIILVIVNVVLFTTNGWTESVQNTFGISFGGYIGVVLASIYISNHTSSIDMKELRDILSKQDIQTDTVSIVSITEKNDKSYLTVKDDANNTYAVLLKRQFKNEFSEHLETNDFKALTVNIVVKNDKLLHYTAE